MNNADYVRAGLNRAAAEGLFNEKNLRTLQKNEKFIVDTLNKAEKDGVLCEEEPHKTKYFYNVCNFVLETSSFLFKEALSDFSKKASLDGPEFYKKIWLAKQEVGLNRKFGITTKDLYIKYYFVPFSKNYVEEISIND